MIHLLLVVLAAALVVWVIQYLIGDKIDAFFMKVIYVIAVVVVVIAAWQALSPLLSGLK